MSSGYNFTLKGFVPCDMQNAGEAMKTLQMIDAAQKDHTKIGDLLKAKDVAIDDFAVKVVGRRAAKD